MKIITVGGVSGVGKTTFITKLAEKFEKKNSKVKIMFELSDDSEYNIFEIDENINDSIFNTTLEVFVKNYHKANEECKDSNVFNKILLHEILFLTNRASKSIKAIKKAKQSEIDYLILDRTVLENKVFAITTIGKYPDLFQEFSLIWQSWVKQFLSEMEEFSSNHIILTAKTENVMERIKNRGRDYEQGEENIQYFSYLNNLYNENIEKTLLMSGIKNYNLIETDGKTPLELVENVMNEF